jgi:hypothetical protein
VLGVAVEEGELDPGLMLAGARSLQLPGGLLGYETARLRIDLTPSPRRKTALAVGTGEVTPNVEA